ncbi:flagellar basal body-associated FliL family protein [Azohydromonas lata]|uniref:Flagellar protein FliL n=1 Tax=Azohydromonas lata TaxID=45677 RepID=A0ABU5IEH5_9BURK|nr:flagellar basal body-associated FliL family protein [Azohydromonas lata]MDZ5457529.1 flagellar basal body-associated FliL family protein [Azohydromonas lata]
MSAAAALAVDTPKKGHKKLIIIVLAVVVLLAAAAGGFMVFKARTAHAEEDEVEVDAAPAKNKQPEAFDPKHAPLFVNLEPITINLADRDVDRYAQIVIALEVEDDKSSDHVKAFMPVIRNNLLMAVANKTSEDVRTDGGRRLLAAEMQAQALRPLGYDLNAEDFMESDASAHAGAGKRKKSHKPAKLPIKAVNFVNFIVQ